VVPDLNYTGYPFWHLAPAATLPIRQRPLVTRHGPSASETDDARLGHIECRDRGTGQDPQFL
jgi:hypothetical protein